MQVRHRRGVTKGQAVQVGIHRGCAERHLAAPPAIFDFAGVDNLPAEDQRRSPDCRHCALLQAADCATRYSTARSCASGAPAQFILSSRSEEHTSELQSLMRISYAVF